MKTHHLPYISPPYRCRKCPFYQSRHFPQEHCSPRLGDISLGMNCQHYTITNIIITRRYEVLVGDIVAGSPPPALAAILTVLHTTVPTRGMYPKTIGNATLSSDKEITIWD